MEEEQHPAAVHGERVDDDHVLVVVSEGLSGGDVMMLELEDGHAIEVEVPEGLHAGDEFEAFVGHIGAPDEISGAPHDDDHDAEQHGE